MSEAGQVERWRLDVLGPFGLWSPSGDARSIGSKKARALLAYLAIANHRGASRDSLAALLWPDRQTTQAKQSLRQAISSLRKTLADTNRTILSSDADQLTLSPELVDVDLHRLQEACELDSGEACRLACARIGGHFLEEHVFGLDEIDDWVRDQRARLQASCRKLLFRTIELERREGNDERVSELYWQLLGIDAACEEAHRGLMRHYAATGNRSEALAQYQACEDALARHLGAKPSEETESLYQALADDELGEPAPTRQAPPTLPLLDEPTVAVLPFENLGGDPSKDYLSDGISEDITTFLGQFSSLVVISRRSAFSFKGSSLPISEIGRQLGVHYLLEGSVRSAGDALRVTVQLVEAEQGRSIWSNRYDGTLAEVFDFQDDIAQRIVATVAGRIESAALQRARRKAQKDLSAYECVLKGKHHHHQCTVEDAQRAIEFFEQAIEHDPSSALARGWLLCATGRAAGLARERAEWMSSPEYKNMMDRGLESATIGESIDDEESEVLRLIGEVHLFRRNYDEAERYFRRATAFNPNDDRILSQLAAFFTYTGSYEEAEANARRAIRINPFHPGFYRLNLARALMGLGRYDEAVTELRAALPMRNLYRAYLAACHVALEDQERARETCAEILEAEPGFSLEVFRASMLYRDPAVVNELLELMKKAGLPE